MSNRGGRKIYRNSSSVKRRRTKAAINAVVITIAILIVAFVGYSVAKPIFNYFSNADKEEKKEPWTAPELVEPEETAELPSEQQSEVTSSVDTEPVNSDMKFTAFRLPYEALISVEALADYAAQIKGDGYNAVCVTLKAEGGKIYYSTLSEFAYTDENAVIGTMKAEEIVTVIKNCGLKAFASINILEDNNRYGENRDGSYHTIDGSTWLDNSAAKGGKPWLSPFESETVGYTSELFKEAAAAGFDAVIADGLVFPTFRNSDIVYLGEAVRNDDRYKYLVSLVNISYAAASENDTEFMLKLNAADIINDTAEVFRPDELTDVKLLVEYIPSELNGTVVYEDNVIVLSDLSAADKFSAVFNIISSKAGDNIKIIPEIKYSSFNHSDYNDVIAELVSENYESYIVE